MGLNAVLVCLLLPSVHHFSSTIICSWSYRGWSSPAGPGTWFCSIWQAWGWEAGESQDGRWGNEVGFLYRGNCSCLTHSLCKVPRICFYALCWVHVSFLLSCWMVLQLERQSQACVRFIHVSFLHSSLSCFCPHGDDQPWWQRSVSSYTLQILFVEKAGGAHTMVKAMLNVPFRNNSGIWTKSRSRTQQHAQSWDEHAAQKPY